MRTWTRTALDGREKYVFINETPVTPLKAQSGNICAIASSPNFITWERAYSIFGFPTFIKKTAYRILEGTGRMEVELVVPFIIRRVEIEGR